MNAFCLDIYLVFKVLLITNLIIQFSLFFLDKMFSQIVLVKLNGER